MKIYSLDKINEMSGGDQEFAAELIHAFLEEIPQDLKWLEESFENEDVQEIYQASHKIKPNLDLVDSQESYQLVVELNSLAKREAAVDEIRPLYQKALPLIDQLLETLAKDFS